LTMAGDVGDRRSRPWLKSVPRGGRGSEDGILAAPSASPPESHSAGISKRPPSKAAGSSEGNDDPAAGAIALDRMRAQTVR